MNRFFTTLFVALTFCFQWMQADVTVTFNVNMNHIVVNPGGVFVAGGNIGNPGQNELTDPDADGIYSGSIVVADNFFSFYTILNGNCGDYSCKERIAGQSCSDPNNFDDRQFQAGTTDMTINTCFGVCSTVTTCSMVTVDFSVNMEDQIVDPAGVFLAGGIGFGQPGDIPMLDLDLDNKYEVSLMLPTDYSDHFTFTNGLCPGDFSCKEQLGGQPCGDPNFFNDREIIVGANDMFFNTCFGTCSTDGTCALETYAVTFQVDMNGEGANPAGVNMGSNIDGWSGNIVMSDPDGDGVYSVTLDVVPGSYEYKFINGPGWANGPAEFVPIECDVTNGNNQNRGVTVTNADVVLPPVCFGSCTEECPVVVEVTFKVDMSKVPTNPGGVFMGASFDGWSGNLALSDPDGDDVWEYTATLPPGDFEYKFINGPNWTDGGENVPAACDVVPDPAFANRGVTVPDNETSEMMLDVVCFAACVGCDEFVDVTFRVNMALQNTNPGGVFMGSNIDGWSGNIALSQWNGSSTWFVTLNLAPGSYEYKFINGPNWTDGGENVPAACDVTVDIPGGPFGNRGVDVSVGTGSLILPAVCFASCDPCPKIGCTDSGAHNFSPRAELDPSSKTFYWDDVAFLDLASNYCVTEVTHFAGDPGSEVFLTVTNVDATSMEVIIESATADPVDFLLVNGGSGAAISAEDASVPGQIKRTLTWTTPPTDVALNVLWSKASFGGNWQLSTNDIMVAFAADCSGATIATGDLPLTFDDPAFNYDLADFGGTYSQIVTDPTDPTNMVVETTKGPLSEVWAGTAAGAGGGFLPIPFTATSTKISVRVWSPQAGIPVLLKVEGSGPTSEVEVNTTVAMAWETMTFDFANGTPALDFNSTYNKVVIFFEFGTAYPAPLCETCTDGIQNGDETGIDCGGSNPNCSDCLPDAPDVLGCTDVAAHNFDPLATTNDGSCETCSDGVMNGDETAVDCGGLCGGFCNDDCADAEELACGDAVTGSTLSSTFSDPGGTCGTGVFGPGVWYKISGSNLNITASLCNPGTDFDTKINIYSGTCGSLVCETGNDDACGVSSEATWYGASGTDYYILIHGFAGAVGNFELSITCVDPPVITSIETVGVPPFGVSGAIDITVQGGCEPYTYAWTGPSGFTATTEDLTGLTVAGDYTVVVTDCANETTTATVNLPTRGRGGRGRKASFVQDAMFKANPNPFGQQTLITFNVPVEEQISLDVYDVAGKKVSSLFSGMAEADKNYQFQFGQNLPTGTYVATLTAASGEVRHIKLILAH